MLLILILLDSAVILGLVYLFNDGDAPGWGTAILTAVAVSLGFVGCGYFLVGAIGLLALGPMAAVAGLMLWILCDVPIQKAMIAGDILLAYKIGFGLAMHFLLG